jgi:DNA-binding transcriptional ArsR family regulator
MHTDPLSLQFAALADPTRRAILARLSVGETSVNDLAEPFALSLPAISRHLKVLEHAGLVSRSRTAQWRPAKLEPHAMKGIADWIDQYRHFWESSFERLDAYLKRVQSGGDDGSRH